MIVLLSSQLDCITEKESMSKDTVGSRSAGRTESTVRQFFADAAAIDG